MGNTASTSETAGGTGVGVAAITSPTGAAAAAALVTASIQEPAKPAPTDSPAATTAAPTETKLENEVARKSHLLSPSLSSASTVTESPTLTPRLQPSVSRSPHHQPVQSSHQHQQQQQQQSRLEELRSATPIFLGRGSPSPSPSPRSTVASPHADVPASPSHMPLARRPTRSSSSAQMSLCANCGKMSTAAVLLHTLVFCSKECYWSHHVLQGLDDEPDGAMVIRCTKEPPVADSYVANRNVQRHRKSISHATANGGAAASSSFGHASPTIRMVRHSSFESPISSSGVVSSASRDSLTALDLGPAAANPTAAATGAPTSSNPLLQSPTSTRSVSHSGGIGLASYACEEVEEEFLEELDDSLPTPPWTIPRAPPIKSLKPFALPIAAITAAGNDRDPAAKANCKH